MKIKLRWMNKKNLTQKQVEKIKLLLNQLSKRCETTFVWGKVNKSWYSIDDLADKLGYSVSRIKQLIQLARGHWDELDIPNKFIVSFCGKYQLTADKQLLKKYSQSIRQSTHKKTKIFNNLLDVMEVEDE